MPSSARPPLIASTVATVMASGPGRRYVEAVISVPEPDPFGLDGEPGQRGPRVGRAVAGVVRRRCPGSGRSGRRRRSRPPRSPGPAPGSGRSWHRGAARAGRASSSRGFSDFSSERTGCLPPGPAGSGRRPGARWPARAGPAPRPRSAARPAGTGCGTGSRSAGGSATAARPGSSGDGPRLGPSGPGTESSSARGVRVQRLPVDRLPRPDLAQLAEVHHRHPVADLLDQGQVVRDEQVGQAEFGPQPLEQVEHLGLDEHVQRGHRLVADDQRRGRAPRRGRWPPAGPGRRTAPGAAGRRTGPGRPARAPRPPGAAWRSCHPSCRRSAALPPGPAPATSGPASRTGPGRPSAGAAGPAAAVRRAA